MQLKNKIAEFIGSLVKFKERLLYARNLKMNRIIIYTRLIQGVLITVTLSQQVQFTFAVTRFFFHSIILNKQNEMQKKILVSIEKIKALELRGGCTNLCQFKSQYKIRTIQKPVKNAKLDLD